MKHIGVFTSGGDSPGMNACIRAVVRTALYHNIQVSGIVHGYEGLIDNEIISLKASSVGNIIQRGGTILKTSRSKRFMTKEGMNTAYENLKRSGIEAIVAIGGDGTFKGAKEFGEMFNIPIVGAPGTIDNDLVGTDFTIGYDTAINTVIEAVDKIRDTASSHDRLFLVEVMGRDAGLIALRSGIGVGAEAIFIPETENDILGLVNKLKHERRRKKSSSIIMVAEGDEMGGAQGIAKKITEHLPHFDIKVAILGHIQRGGAPSCMDRVFASRIGYHAVNALLENKKGVMVGIVDKKVCYTPFDKAVKHIQMLDTDLLKMIDILAI